MKETLCYKKTIRQLLFLVLVWPVFAQAKDVNHVWLPWIGGNVETICRHLWTTHDRMFNTSTTINIKQGAGGELAIRDILDSKETNRSLCITGGMWIYNQYLPDIKTRSTELDLLVKIVNLPTVWYTPNSTPAAKNLEEYVAYLRSLKRPINAGIFNNQARSILQVLAKNYHLDINLIVFKNGPQMYPSLIDGSLDLALDSGGGIPTAEQGRFKLIGHVSSGPITRLRSYVNFASDSKELLAIESWMGIAVPKNLRAETKQQLTQQIVSIVRQDSFRAFVDDAIASVDGSSGQRLTMIIDNQKKLVEKYWQ